MSLRPRPLTSSVSHHVKRLARFAAILLSAASLVSCFRYAGYKGDGHFTDNGWLNYSNRYTVDLGAVDLATPGSKIYTLRGLPRAEFCIGLTVNVEPESNVIARVVLTAANGEVIVSEEGPLRSWVASTAVGSNKWFLYRRGERRDIPLPNGDTRGERLNVRRSGGWGTYFNSERRAVYSLTIQVLPNSNAPRDLSAHLRLSGWDR